MATVKETRIYELKEKAAKYYAENGVPQKMEDVLNAMFYDNPNDVYGHLVNYFQTFAKTPTLSKVQANAAIDGKGQVTLQTDVYCIVNNKEKLMNTSLGSSAAPVVPDSIRPEDIEEDNKARSTNVAAAIKLVNSDISNRLQGVDPTKQNEVDSIVSKFVADLKAAEDECLALAAQSQDTNVDNEVTDKKPTSVASKSDKPKSGKSKGGKGSAQVTYTPDEPREKFLSGSICVSIISQAVCCAGAAVQESQPFEYVANLRFGKVPTAFRMPLPMVTIFQSGRTAPGKSNCIKEYMLVPKPGKLLKESLPMITAVYNDIIKASISKTGITIRNVTDIGALMMPFDRPEQGLDMIQDSMTRLNISPGEDLCMALNLAAHEIFDYEKGKYEVITGQQKLADDMVDYWSDLLSRYPSVIAIIDPFRKTDDKPWMSLCEKISNRCYIIGDNVWKRPGLLKDEQLKESFKTSGVVYRFEQMNTVSDLLECAQKMEDAVIETVLSTSIGETTDSFLADMAVGMSARFIKVGAPCRGERVAKLNRLLAIEEYLYSCDRLTPPEEFKFPLITVPLPPVITDEDAIVEKEIPLPKESPKKK